MPHAHPVTRWHHAAVALAVAAQTFALVLASPWSQPAWALLFAAALAAATLPTLRTRAAWSALSARLLLTLATLGLGALLMRHLTGPTHRLARMEFALAAAFWLWALHAPLSMSRWWVGARPAQDAALELAEVVGLSLLATAAALTARNPTLAWSLAHGSAWSTGLCGALGVGALAWSWTAQARRRAWMRRVEAGDDPTWELVAADATATADPWTHAAVGDGAARMLRARGDGEHYRTAGVRVPVAGVGARDGRAWRVRRGLHAVALVWGIGLAYWGAGTLLHVEPRDAWDDVTDALRAVRVGDDPCVVNAPPVRERPVSAAFVEVSASGRVERLGTDRPGSWCVSPATARELIDAADRRRLPVDEQVLTTPEQLAPVVCARGRWCSLTWGEHTIQGEDGQVQSVLICALQNNGAFNCEEGNEHHAGRVSPEAARALIATVERYARQQHARETTEFPALFVQSGGEAVGRSLAFPGSREIGRELRRRLFPQYAASPLAPPITNPDLPTQGRLSQPEINGAAPIIANELE